MRSEVLNASSGIQQAQSVIIYDGEAGVMHVQTRMDKGVFEECWQLDLGKTASHPKVNPFAGAQKANGQASWYEFFIPNARVEFSVGQASGSLEELWFEDLTRHVDINVRINKWSTLPIPDVWWQHRGKSSCPSLKHSRGDSQRMSHWHIINTFFPTPPSHSPSWPPSADQSAQPGRRLEVEV